MMSDFESFASLLEEVNGKRTKNQRANLLQENNSAPLRTIMWCLITKPEFVISSSGLPDWNEMAMGSAADDETAMHHFRQWVEKVYVGPSSWSEEKAKTELIEMCKTYSIDKEDWELLKNILDNTNPYGKINSDVAALTWPHMFG